MVSGSGRYARGNKALGMCERCSKKVLLKELQYDGYIKDLQVCPDCWDPYHPQDRLPAINDPVTLRDPTGDPDKAQASVTKIAWPPWQPLPAHGGGTPTGGYSSASAWNDNEFILHPLAIQPAVGVTRYPTTNLEAP